MVMTSQPPPTYLVDTVEELQEDGGPLIGVGGVTKPLLELVSK